MSCGGGSQTDRQEPLFTSSQIFQEDADTQEVQDVQEAEDSSDILAQDELVSDDPSSGAPLLDDPGILPNQPTAQRAPPAGYQARLSTVRMASISALDDLVPRRDHVKKDFHQDFEYDRNLSAYDLVNARAAYARGATGYGVIVGVVDDFLHVGHREFAGMLQNIGNDRLVSVVTAEGESWHIAVGFDPSALHTQEDVNQINHGTKVAGVIAARRDGQSDVPRNMHGLAYESALIFRSYHPIGDIPGVSSTSLFNALEKEGENPQSYAEIPDELNSTAKVRDIALASAFTEIVDGGAHVVNASVGFGDYLYNYDSGADGVTIEMITAALPNIVQALHDAQGRALIVFAAGNQRYRRPALSPVLPYALQVYYEDLRAHVVTAVSVHSTTGKIVESSNLCGVAAEWCIAAPGHYLAAPLLQVPSEQEGLSATGYTSYFGGTSAAAPVVTGGLALLIDHFGLDEYTLSDILRRLYDTANKSDYSDQGGPDYSNKEFYGQGLMDLAAAVQPFGETKLLLGSDLATARAFSVEESRIHLGFAFGDGLKLALAGQSGVFFDELNFAFPMSARAYLKEASINYARLRLESLGREAASSLWTHQTPNFAFFGGQGRMDWPQMSAHMPAHGFFALGGNAASAHQFPQKFSSKFYGGLTLHFGQHDFSSLFFATLHDKDVAAQDEAANDVANYGLGLSYHFRPDFATFTLEVGMLQEPQGFLSSQSAGAFASQGTGQTLFASLGAETDLSADMRGFARAAFGRTQAPAARLGLSFMTEILSASWVVGAYRKNVWHDGDRLALFLSQPLRVERGAANIHYVSARRADRSLVEEVRPVSLVPSGRSLNLECSYHWRFLSLAAGYLFDPAHRQNAAGDAYILARISFILP